MSKQKKIVLAYSGGLDTSVLLSWIKDKHHAEMIAFCADIGQEDELKGLKQKALKTGASKLYVDDLQAEFARDFIFPMMQAGAIYEGQYYLGTSIARPLIAKRMVEIAKAEKADAIAHGATGKGNDQVRFELGYYALEPGIHVIAPWREWDFKSREQLIAFAEKNQITIPKDKRGESPFSTDANLLHTSSEGKVLEDPWDEVPDYVYSRTVNPEDAPDQPETITIDFERGDGVALNGEACSPATLLTKLNVVNDPYLEATRKSLESLLVGVTTEDLRNSAPARKELKVEVDAILKRFDF